MSEGDARAIRIDADERYPTFSVREKYGHEVTATGDQLERWAKAEQAYNEAQREMEALWEEAEAAERAERERIKSEQEAAAKAARKAESQRITKVNAKYNAARARLADAEVYDADGNPVGRVRSGSFGLRLDVELGDSDD